MFVLHTLCYLGGSVFFLSFLFCRFFFVVVWSIYFLVTSGVTSVWNIVLVFIEIIVVSHWKNTSNKKYANFIEILRHMLSYNWIEIFVTQKYDDKLCLIWRKQVLSTESFAITSIVIFRKNNFRSSLPLHSAYIHYFIIW